MKKTITGIMTAALLTSMLMCSVASAAGPIEVYNDSGAVTVNVTNLSESEEATLLVVHGADTTISQAFADTTKVHHIDQTAANSDGVAEFRFNAAGSGTYKIYSGYATMSNSAPALNAVLDESTPPSPGGGYTLGDVNGDEAVNVSDITSVVQFILNGTEFTKTDGITFYEYGKKAADVNIDTAVNVSDVTGIVNYILNGSFTE